MRVLLFGSGAREHALADKILSSELIEKLYLTQCGECFSHLGEVIEFRDYKDLAKKAADKKIDLLVVGPEKPLVDGICDIFLEHGIKTIGANSYWAQLEGSKSFAKDFMLRNGILSADFCLLDSVSQIDAAIEKFNIPPVIKADGLCGGKGVIVCNSFEQAKNTAKELLEGKFSSASKKIIMEQRLYGRELSVFSLWDGKTLLNLPPACDFKKLLDNDKGANTGGMGAGFPCLLNSTAQEAVSLYLNNLKSALLREKADFCGVIYSGLMLCDDKIYVLEYNMRFGDPEIQAMVQNWENDILEVFKKMSEQKLCDVELKFSNEPSYCVVLASEGYPVTPLRGAEIFNIEDVAKKYGVKIYYSGAKKIENRFFVDGGRVLSLCKNGKDALCDVYKAADEIKFEGKIFRRDIKIR